MNYQDSAFSFVWRYNIAITRRLLKRDVVREVANYKSSLKCDIALEENDVMHNVHATSRFKLKPGVAFINATLPFKTLRRPLKTRRAMAAMEHHSFETQNWYFQFILFLPTTCYFKEQERLYKTLTDNIFTERKNKQLSLK